MIVPGSNILSLALRAIRAQPVNLYRFAGNVDQANGNDAPTYEAPVAIVGSVQPVDQKTAVMLGLDWNKRYVRLFTATDVHDTARGTAPDVFEFGGVYYSVQGQVDWILMDGWNDILAVAVPPIPAAQVLA